MNKSRLKTKRDIMEFTGTWKNISEEVIESVKNEIKNLRRKSINELNGRHFLKCPV